MGDATKILLFRAVLETIEREGLQMRVLDVGGRLMNILREVAVSNPAYVRNVRGVGTIIAFDCESPAHRDRLASSLRNNGVLVGTNGTQSIRFRPALTFGVDQFEEFRVAFGKTLVQVA
jgi:4-aminobutyrate aminotransferase-like enzyme